MTTLANATLVIKVDSEQTKRPSEIVVLAGSHMIARVSIKEVRRVLEQVDRMMEGIDDDGERE
jgi:hypothetical protein